MQIRKKMLAMIIISLIYSICIYAENTLGIKLLNKIPGAIVTEYEISKKHSLIISNGYAYLKGRVTFAEEKTYDVIFLIDTGAGSSYILGNNYTKVSKYFTYKIQGENYALTLCDAEFDDFKINNWSLFANQTEYLPPAHTELFSEDCLFGILGNDILMSKSFFLSLSESYFKWCDEIGINQEQYRNYRKIVPHTFIQTIGQRDYYMYQIDIEDDFFISDSRDYIIFDIFKSYDGKKSRYLVDTGTYNITTMIKDAYYLINRYGYNHYYLKDEIGIRYGICKINNISVLDKKFDYVYADCGAFEKKAFPLKSLGIQILSAFDIFFDTDGTNRVREISFFESENNKYKEFRKKYDEGHFIPNYSYGFYANKSGKILMKTFWNEKEMLPKVQIGDVISSINGIPYKNVKLNTLPEKIQLNMQRKDGSEYTQWCRKRFLD